MARNYWNLLERTEFRGERADATFYFAPLIEGRMIQLGENIWINGCIRYQNNFYYYSNYNNGYPNCFSTLSDITENSFTLTTGTGANELAVAFPFHLHEGETISITHTRNAHNRTGYQIFNINGTYNSYTFKNLSNSPGAVDTITYTATTECYFFWICGRQDAGTSVTISDIVVNITPERYTPVTPELYLTKPRLPLEYQEVAYLQNKYHSGRRPYIDLGIKYDTACRIEAGMICAENEPQSYWFGALDSTNANMRCIIEIVANSAIQTQGYITGSYTSGKLDSVTGLNEIECIFKQGEKISLKNKTTGTTATSGSPILSYTMSNNLYLFCRSLSDGSPQYGADTSTPTFTYFRYYDKNNLLILDLVPCYRKSDRTLGMYNLVNGQLLTSANGNAFISGGEVGGKVTKIFIPEGEVKKIEYNNAIIWQSSEFSNDLPNEYQKVEYISAATNVAAYIDLGFNYDKGCRIKVGMYKEGQSNAYLFGAAESSGKYRCMISAPYSSTTKAYVYGYNGSTDAYWSSNFIDLVDGLNELEIVMKQGYTLEANNTTNQIKESLNSPHGLYTMSSNLYLLAQNYNGSPRYGNLRKVSYFQYYDVSDTLICDLVPCYRKSDGAIGMYDLVRQIFLEKSGTGAFTKGPDVN